MPDRNVKTIQDLIFYQYAKIMARRAFGAGDERDCHVPTSRDSQ